MTAPGVRVRVVNTLKKVGDLFVHEVVVDEGALTEGLALELSVDRRAARRRPRQSFGHASAARGAASGARRPCRAEGLPCRPRAAALRFHPSQAVEPAELARRSRTSPIASVLENAPVDHAADGVDDAIASGARALFGEKYGDEVRVVSMGAGENVGSYSVELCGGTHVGRTGDIGLVSIVSESAVASGVRRIEAKTGDAARHHLNAEARRLRELAGLLKAAPDDAPERVAALLDDRRKLERELSDARKKLAMGGGASGAPAAQDLGGVRFLGRAVTGVEMKDLKSLADEAKQSLGSGVAVIVGVSDDGKAGAVVGVTADLTARFNAVDLVRVASEKLGGKGGGGRPDMAQAGGPDGAAAEAAIAAVAAGGAIQGECVMERRRRARILRARRRVHVILDGGSSDWPSVLVHRGLVALVLVSVTAVVFESVATIAARHTTLFRVIEYFVAALFTVEYALRLWSAPEHTPTRAWRHGRRGWPSPASRLRHRRSAGHRPGLSGNAARPAGCRRAADPAPCCASSSSAAIRPACARSGQCAGGREKRALFGFGGHPRSARW
jgi:hypothetical protein